MILVILSSISFFLIKISIIITGMAGRKNVANAREWLAWIDIELASRERTREWLANKGGFNSSKFSHIESGHQGIGYEVAIPTPPLSKRWLPTRPTRSSQLQRPSRQRRPQSQPRRPAHRPRRSTPLRQSPRRPRPPSRPQPRQCSRRRRPRGGGLTRRGGRASKMR